jgi:RsiW-degrading membrane proteinase PrsW (M82 family)
MYLELLPRVPVALLPVVAFLCGLMLLDSFRLVRASTVVYAMLVGTFVAGGSYWANDLALAATNMPFPAFSRFVSPVIEETLKAAVLVYLVQTRRVGTLVDGAIFGFAIGTGFAVVENLFYLAHRPDAPLALHVVRGFGTAIMHGGATCIFAMISVALAERRPDGLLSVYLPGLIAAVALHSAYNHLLVWPAVATLAILLVLPPLLYFVFQRSERALRQWLDADLDSDMALLELLDAGDVERSPVGHYLKSLREKYRGAVVADMLCYLRLHSELAVRAKGVLLLRESGLNAEVDEETRASLAELQYLERSIGRAGRLALRPVLGLSSRDLWQIYLLER